MNHVCKTILAFLMLSLFTLVGENLNEELRPRYDFKVQIALPSQNQMAMLTPQNPSITLTDGTTISAGLSPSVIGEHCLRIKRTENLTPTRYIPAYSWVQEFRVGVNFYQDPLAFYTVQPGGHRDVIIYADK